MSLRQIKRRNSKAAIAETCPDSTGLSIHGRKIRTGVGELQQIAVGILATALFLAGNGLELSRSCQPGKPKSSPCRQSQVDTTEGKPAAQTSRRCKETGKNAGDWC
ncbi:hypothetical protein [Laribacter hongkongensis]|uniref:hypothetical protein n=1 Tax=Laribacter hongkongensis TaxID=168471 RepID=UPI001EFCD0B7|nr:hypothetical protein [Laribacter hongkongensis]